MLIYLGGLQGIPSELYEAADVDGAGPLPKFLHITVPMMTPVIFFNMIIGIINALQEFVAPYVMTGGGPHNSSLFLVLYLYRNAFQMFQMGYASAIAWILFIYIMILTALVVRSSSAWVHYEGSARGQMSIDSTQTWPQGKRRPIQPAQLFRVAIYITLILGSILVMMPFAWTLSTSLKAPEDVMAFPPRWIPDPIVWSNYHEALTVYPFGLWLQNTLFVVIFSTTATLISCSLVAYSFARLRWPGRNIFFILLLSTMMLPEQVTLIPTFIVFRHLGWVNTFLPLIIPPLFARTLFMCFCCASSL